MGDHRPRIMVVGLRGFPGIQGGVETHAQHLLPLVAELGFDVTVLARACYLPKDHPPEWHGVRFVSIWSPRSRALEAIVHTALSVLYAGWKRPDILHIQAIGPGIMTGLARLLGLRVVVTHHGPDYARQKWGWLGKSTLKTGEWMGMRLSDARIVISETIRTLVREKYGKDSVLIPNGVLPVPLPETTAALERFGLDANRYVLLVSRLVPEKRHLDLIDAFVKAGLPGWKLVLVGAADHPDPYSASVMERTEATPGVVATGFQSGLTLTELYAHAGLFVLPSSHEGLPIALLEALSFGLPVVASDIPANLEIGLEANCYFKLGDVGALARRLLEQAPAAGDAAARQRRREWVTGRYDWHVIAEKTVALYHAVIDGRTPGGPDGGMSKMADGMPPADPSPSATAGRRDT